MGIAANGLKIGSAISLTIYALRAGKQLAAITVTARTRESGQTALLPSSIREDWEIQEFHSLQEVLSNASAHHISPLLLFLPILIGSGFYGTYQHAKALLEEKNNPDKVADKKDSPLTQKKNLKNKHHRKKS